MMCVLLMALGAACGGDGNGNPGELYPDRANQYREDQERHIGEAVMIGGYTTKVTGVQLDDGSIRVSIEISSDSNPGPLPFTQTQDVEIRNRLPGNVGCG